MRPTFYSESQSVRFGPPLSCKVDSMAKQITNDQRNEIYALKRAGHKQKDIARILHKDPSAICRELKRNQSNPGRYLAREAKLKPKERGIKATNDSKRLN